MTQKLNDTVEFDGVGTHWWIELIDQSDFDAKIANMLKHAVYNFDDNYSRFKQDSLIGQLNTHKKLQNPPLELLDMFDFAHKMHDVSDGVFDISVGGTLQRLGYGDTKTAKASYPNFWEEVIYDDSDIVLPKNSAVDFGGFGKGWLLDKLAVMLEQNGFPHYLINGGGDIVLSAPEPIELGLEHPYDHTKIIGKTKISHGALAVSSTVKRRWVKRGKSFHHIIDPKTQKSTENGIVGTYVKGPTALIADTLATIGLLRPELSGKFERQFDVQIITIKTEQIST